MNPEKYGFTVVENGMPSTSRNGNKIVKPDGISEQLAAMQKQINEILGIIDELSVRVDEVAVRVTPDKSED